MTDSSRPNSPKVWSVIVDFLANDFEHAVTRRALIEMAIADQGLPASVSTVAEVAPLVQFEEDEE